MKNLEIHPDWYYNKPKMRTLILGSFPPHFNKRKFEFYYPNPQNNFWKILAQISAHSLQNFEGAAAVNERKQILKRLAIGVENMGQKILRQGKSSKDTDIEILAYHSIIEIINQHPELEIIILAGYSAKHSTLVSFLKYCEQTGIPFDQPEKIKPEVCFHIHIKQRRIPCVILHSTSTASRIQLGALVEEYAKFIK